MALTEFSIIVSIDAGNGISKNGDIPWNSAETLRFFRDQTIGKRKNVVIMGRGTYEAIPEEHRPLEGRKCVIISRTWKQEQHPNISVYPSLIDALAGLGASKTSYDDIYVAGGEHLYEEAVKDLMYLCKRVYVTKFKTDYGCTQFFPYEYVKNLPQLSESVKTRDYTRYTFAPNVVHEEVQYLNYLREIRNTGETKPDRTNTGVQSLFGSVHMEYDISSRLPVITTKKINFDAIVKELIFFISGNTDANVLKEQNVNIWNDNTSEESLKAKKLTYKMEDEEGDIREVPYKPGDMGPMYGFQWRHWGADYKGCSENYKGQGIDQLRILVDQIRDNPHSRRHILTSWNVSQIKDMALPPCHPIAQFNVSGDRKYLDCMMFQRSGDMFLGVPFNITSYCLLTYMIAHVTNLKPRKFIHVIGDAHIYSTHVEQVTRQLTRTPRPFPKLSFRESTRLHELSDFSSNSFVLEGYSPCPMISAKMAV